MNWLSGDDGQRDMSKVEARRTLNAHLVRAERNHVVPILPRRARDDGLCELDGVRADGRAAADNKESLAGLEERDVEEALVGRDRDGGDASSFCGGRGGEVWACGEQRRVGDGEFGKCALVRFECVECGRGRTSEGRWWW